VLWPLGLCVVAFSSDDASRITILAPTLPHNKQRRGVAASGFLAAPPVPVPKTEQTTTSCAVVVASFGRSLLPRVLHTSRLGRVVAHGMSHEFVEVNRLQMTGLGI